MSKELKCNQITIRPFQDSMFLEFFNIDSDYSENQEYFRNDTLWLGFKSEAERVSKHYSKKFTQEWNKLVNLNADSDENFMGLIDKLLQDCSKDHSIDSQFILGNSCFTDQYVITPVFNTSKTLDYNEGIEVVISYI